MQPICRAKSSAAFVWAASMALSVDAEASTRRVPSEYATINVAIDASSSGDTVLVAPGTYAVPETRFFDGGAYALTCMVFLKAGVSVVSEAGPTATILDPSGSRIVGDTFVVYGFEMPQPILFEGFTVTGERRGIGIFLSAKLTVRNCHFLELESEEGYGGGITASFTPLDVLGCRFSRCRGDYGTALLHSVDNLIMGDCLVENCTGTGPAVEVRHDYNHPFHSFRIERTAFRNNAGEVASGALRVQREAYRGIVRDCVFEGNSAGLWSGGAMSGGGYELRIEGNLFVGNSVRGFTAGGGAISLSGYNMVIANNTFVDNHRTTASYGGSALALNFASVHLARNVFAGNGPSAAVSKGPDSFLFQNDCNVYWDNPGGHTSGFTMSPTDRVVDPEFCDPDANNFALSPTSPCLAENSLGCGQIGAIGLGCGTISVESRSWAQVKALYR